MGCRRRKRKSQRIHQNKYAHLVPKRVLTYDADDKTFRDLPLHGKVGEVVRQGHIALFHGRRYRLIANTKILGDMTFGRFRIVGYI